MYKNKFRIWSKTSNQYINLQTSGYYVALDDDNGELKIFSLDTGDYYGCGRFHPFRVEFQAA